MPVLACGAKERRRVGSIPREGGGEKKEERKGETSWEDAVYWRFADIKWREKEEEDSWTLEKPCPGTDK